MQVLCWEVLPPDVFMVSEI